MKNKVNDIMAEMVRFSGGNLADIRHFMNVYECAVQIAEEEGLDPAEKYRLEISALVHDIACPICREKYGNTDWRRQEEESGAVLEGFLRPFGLDGDDFDSVMFNVCHHHTPGSADTRDFQILIEADAIVNAVEKKYTGETVENLEKNIFKTASGKKLLRSETGGENGEASAVETERKWLIRKQDIPYDLDSLESREIEQFYISVIPTIRARSFDGKKFVLTVKTKTDSELSRIETEAELCREEFDSLKAMMKGFPVRKTRYFHPVGGGLVEEIDVFRDNLDGLLLLEIEFPYRSQAQAYGDPDWAVKEVTFDRRYKNGALALSGTVPGE